MDRKLHIPTELLMQAKEIADKMLVQDNAATHNPLYAVQEQRPIHCEEDPTHFMISYADDPSPFLITYEEFEEDEDKYTDDETYCEPVRLEWRFVERVPPFLTREAAQSHIEHESYHYRNPRIYVISAGRNKEMAFVLKLLIALTGEENPDFYDKYKSKPL